jgi:hypothetical protein
MRLGACVVHKSTESENKSFAMQEIPNRSVNPADQKKWVPRNASQLIASETVINKSFMCRL